MLLCHEPHQWHLSLASCSFKSKLYIYFHGLIDCFSLKPTSKRLHMTDTTEQKVGYEPHGLLEIC